MSSLLVSRDTEASKVLHCRGALADDRLAYIQESDHETLNKTNTILLENAVQAVEKAAPALKTFILQTGGKA